MTHNTDIPPQTLNTQFPWGIYIGDLFHPEHGDLPVMLPSEQGGFIIEYEDNDITICNNLIEQICLGLASAIKPNLINFHIFDYSRQKRFVYLAELSQLGWYETYTDSSQAELGFNKLDAESLNRHQQHFSIRLPDIASYNQHNSGRPLAYRVLVINLEYFPNERISIKRFTEFVKSAMNAGYYIIMMISLEMQTDEHQRHYHSLYNALPTLSLKKQEIILNPELFGYSDLQTMHGFTFRPIDQNKLYLIEQLQTSQQQESAITESDFLQIPIATSSDGDRQIYFSMGEASGNYHAIITGSTGTGKSVLLNNLITSIAEKYTADEVRLDLMDFKQGVEFQSFIHHPNVEHLFLENAGKQAAIDLMAHFVTQGQRLGELFRQAKVKNISEYNKKYPDKRLPYRLLIIDEVQNLYEGMDYRQHTILNNLLDNILRQGRAWGNHLIICTQSLKGTMLPKGVINAEAQLRLTLKLNREEDAMESMGYDNAKLATKLRKYELLINTAGGNDRTANQMGIANPPIDIEAVLTSVRLRRQRHQMTEPVIVGVSIHTKNRAEQSTISNVNDDEQNAMPSSKQADEANTKPEFDNPITNKSTPSSLQDGKNNDVIDPSIPDLFAKKDSFADDLFAKWEQERKNNKGTKGKGE